MMVSYNILLNVLTIFVQIKENLNSLMDSFSLSLYLSFIYLSIFRVWIQYILFVFVIFLLSLICSSFPFFSLSLSFFVIVSFSFLLCLISLYFCLIPLFFLCSLLSVCFSLSLRFFVFFSIFSIFSCFFLFFICRFPLFLFYLYFLFSRYCFYNLLREFYLMID